MHRSSTIRSVAMLIIFHNAFAITTSSETELESVSVVANKQKNQSLGGSSARTQTIETSEEYVKRGNIITNLTEFQPTDNIHPTAEQLNNAAGVSILGSSQSISQNISIGGLSDNNIYVGIDGVNNYFSSFGHGHGDNQTRLLPDTFLFKRADVSETGSDITLGSGNLGGAINFVTIDPEDLLLGDQFSTKVGTGYNSVSSGQNTNLGLAAKTGSVGYLLAGVFTNNNDTQLSNGTTLDYSANTNFQAMAKVNIDISKSQQLKLTLLQMQNQGLYPAIINDQVSEDNPTADFILRQSQFSVDYNYKPGSPYFDIQAKFYYLNNYYQSSPTATSLEAIPQQININTSGLKLQNQMLLAEQKILYGLDYTDINGSDSNSSNTMLSFPSATQNLYGLFLQDSWDIINNLNLSAGTRYNAYTSSSGNLNSFGDFFTSQLALNYNFMKDWAGYIAYTEGFSVPTIQDLYLGGVHPYEAGGEPFMTMLPNPNLKPQIGKNKTIGIKYEHKFYPDHTINAGMSVYLNDVDNYILNSYQGSFDNVTTIQNINIDKAQLYGYILTLNYHMPLFSLDSNFTQGYGKSMSSYLNDHGDYVPAGTPLPIPQAKGNFVLGFPIKPIDSKIKVNFNYALSQEQTLPETPTVGGYFLTGLGYNWNPQGQMRGVSINAGVDNIFNQNYQQYDGINTYPGLARNVYLQASYRY
jgi:hemoglobin/transferrin/lactoferrin receptor protein